MDDGPNCGIMAQDVEVFEGKALTKKVIGRVRDVATGAKVRIRCVGERII